MSQPEVYKNSPEQQKLADEWFAKNINTRRPRDGGGLDWEKDYWRMVEKEGIGSSVVFAQACRDFIRSTFGNRGLVELDEGKVKEAVLEADLDFHKIPPCDDEYNDFCYHIAKFICSKFGTPPTKGVNIENIRNAVGSAVLDWEVNEVEVKTRKKKENTKNLVDVVTDSVYAELCGKDNLISNDGVTPTQKGE